MNASMYDSVVAGNQSRVCYVHEHHIIVICDVLILKFRNKNHYLTLKKKYDFVC
jgi:hypothetical protein